MKKIAIVGIQGVPANYGGFETMVENIIGKNCSDGIEYTIFCSAVDMAKSSDMQVYKGAKLRYVKYFRANGAQSTIYDIISLFKCLGKRYDVVLILGVSGCIFLPIFRLLYKGKLIVNIDGLEHRRAKWGRFAKWFLRTSEACAVKVADIIVSDNVGIQNYVAETYKKPSIMIAYGGDTVLRNMSESDCERILDKYGLKKKSYAVCVCRIEPENNCHITLEAYSKSKRNLVFIGNWERSEYGRNLKQQYSKYPNIKIFDPIYDLDSLYALRSNAELYIHGHSAGGTNPSLVEAMFFGIPIYAYDCIYNIETTHNLASYYHNPADLLALLEKAPQNGEAMKVLAYEHYTWKKIATQYEQLY